MDQIIIQTKDPYRVLLGRDLLQQTGPLCREIHEPSKVCIITEETIFSLYGQPIEASLAREGYQVHKIFLPGGEETKRADVLSRIWKTLAKKKFSRSDLLLKIGRAHV